LPLRPGGFALTATLALLTALLPLSTDMYLPSLPAIGRSFDAGPAQAQLTLSTFLVGMVAGQIIYGPLSDSIGRRPALFAGVALFALASMLCAVAHSIETLIAARFVQALGAAGPVVIGRAIVRDLHDGARAGRELSRMGMIMGFIPAIGPVAGGWLEQAFGWRASFWATALAAVALGGFAWRALPETNRAARSRWPGLGRIAQEYREVLKAPAFRAYVAVLIGSHAGLFTFISTATFVLQGRYGLSPLAFGLGFGATGLGFVCGSFVAQRIVTDLGLDGVLRIGVTLIAAAGAMATTLMLAGVPSAFVVLGPAALYTFGHGLVQPQAQAGALMPHPERAGAAASLTGIFQLGCSAIFGFAMAAGVARTPLVLPMGMAAAGLFSAASFAMTCAARAAKH
jgi:DHA1 family bicyclomycin/chloramphenicol resistance-like MFS transporter